MPEPTSIVYLDAATMDGGDIDFSPLEALGKLTLFRHTAPAERIERCRLADIVLTNKVLLDREVLEAAPNLRYVVVTATGTNNVDLKAAAERGLPVSNVSGYSTESVAQHTLTMMLNLATNIHRYAAEAPRWAQSPMFTRLDYRVNELSGQTLGVVGLGTIGHRVAELARAFGMKVVALGRPGGKPADDVPRLDLESFFAQADYITLHCPLTAENKGLINARTLGLMKPTAFLVNTARGPLVDEAALLASLQAGQIAGAALDVLGSEPPAADHPMLTADPSVNLMLTPHSAWASTESRRRLLQGVVGNIQAFLEGRELPNRVA